MKYLYLLLILFLSACAIREPQPPFLINGPHAKIKFDAVELHDKGFDLFENMVDITIFDGSQGCPWRSGDEFNKSLLIGRNLSKHVPMQEIDIPVNGSIYVDIKDHYGNTTCMQAYRFYPVKDAKYELKIITTNDVGRKCSSALYVVSGESMTREPSFEILNLRKNIWLNQISYDEACK